MILPTAQNFSSICSYGSQHQRFFFLSSIQKTSNPSPLRRRSLQRVCMDSTSSSSTSVETSTLTPSSLKTHSDNLFLHPHCPCEKKEKLFVIMGTTGCGKTRLSIDLATQLFPNDSVEIINCDKMQLYKGLDIITNKISVNDRRSVPHHFLDEFDPFHSEFTPAKFRLSANHVVSDIVSKNKLPVLVGGSNSFIYAFLVDQFDPNIDVFDGSNLISTKLRYDCCFLWVDVSMPILCDYLCHRVDEMLDSGMFEELAEFYSSVSDTMSQPELGKAIGVPEFKKYFKKYPWHDDKESRGEREWDDERTQVFEEAVREMKENTCRLMERQRAKIMMLKRAGWDLQRVDATESCRELMMSLNFNEKNNYDNDKIKKNKSNKNKRWMEIWGRDVVEPSIKIAEKFFRRIGFASIISTSVLKIFRKRSG